MSRKISRLTLDRFAELDPPCRSCLFWELDPVRRAQVEPGEEASEKEAWLSGVLREWGSCGRVATVDDVPVGYLIYAPAAFVPGAGAFPTAPVSPDAVLMTTAWVHPSHRGGGLGRMLVQGMARDLIERGGVRAVEAFGNRQLLIDMSIKTHVCSAPEEFLARVGFKTYRAHPTAPRLRMELKSAVSWREEVEVALERLLGVVRPAKTPTPKATRDATE
ncbi:GNAT family N-acetyltransferase [Nocardioides sp.]|uniref:GNAT family N-acetyltransferase n=1 Tax=Nocardioides sp. TaxID=35761 RepID=UPI0039E64220